MNNARLPCVDPALIHVKSPSLGRVACRPSAAPHQFHPVTHAQRQIGVVEVVLLGLCREALSSPFPTDIDTRAFLRHEGKSSEAMLGTMSRRTLPSPSTPVSTSAQTSACWGLLMVAG